MVSNKSLDEYEIIAALLLDVNQRHGAVFNSRSYRLTCKKVKNRIAKEGMSFLTKTLPRLGKAFDKALTEDTPLNCTALGFKPYGDTKLPMLMGEFFSRVLRPDGLPLPEPCITSIKILRDFLYLYYKYELPYDAELEQQVVDQFVKTEHDLSTNQHVIKSLETAVEHITRTARRCPSKEATKRTQVQVVREARILLSRLFAGFDPKDIFPRHGPGAVATRQKLWCKYQWKNISAKITEEYPLDEYFYTSLGHVCDRLESIQTLSDESLPARVILVPKDSRGPRLISCEPVDYQWIQQGLGRAIVEWVERRVPECPVSGKPLKFTARYNVFFTDQGPNQKGALLGSSTGKYATLDLKEASDRVALDLVRLLFPPHIVRCLEACRTSATVLPNGEVLPLIKFAPMGSCLCFPIMALSIWAILTAAAPDTDTRERILVYGDDVVVPTAYAVDAMEQLESFGLKINRDKCCIKGFFRESCGVDAFKGANVTPLRIRTVWSSSRSPGHYSSWIEYSNSFYDRGYFHTYYKIVEELFRIYGPIPDEDMGLTCPSLREVPPYMRPKTFRVSKRYQKRLWYVWDVKAVKIHHPIDGWSRLLRFFTEGARANKQLESDAVRQPTFSDVDEYRAFGTSTYTSRHTSMLVRRWR